MEFVKTEIVTLKHLRIYSTVEKEAFGLLFATRALSVYFGSSRVVVYTDHTCAVLAAYIEFQSETPAMEFRAPGV